jgi:hypothetical protein
MFAADMEKSMNGNRVPLTAFLAGLGAGIALATLLAPRSGIATRRLIGRKVEKGEDWIKDKAVAAQDCIRSQSEDLRDRAKGLTAALGRS